MSRSRAFGGVMLAVAACVAAGGCDLVEQAMGKSSQREPPPAPSLELATKHDKRTAQVVVTSEPRTMVQVVTSEDDRGVRIYPPSAKRTDDQGEAVFTVHSDHSVNLLATAKNAGGETREDLHLEIHTVPTIRITPVGAGKALDEVPCESKELVADGFRPGTLCARGHVSLRKSDHAALFDVGVEGRELSALRIGGETVELSDEPTRVELDFVARIGATALEASYVAVPVELDVPGAGTVSAPLALSRVGLETAMEDVVRRGGWRFDEDHERGAEPTLLLTNPHAVHGPGQTLADVDYIAFTDLKARIVEKCRYTGGKVVERRTTDATVTIYERRTGRKIASTTIRGGKPDRCSNAVTQGAGDQYGGWKSREVEAWVAKIYASKLGG